MTSLIKMLTDWFREAFTANLGLKLLAMTFALGLFAYQRGQEDQQQRTIPVGVVMRLPPDSAKRELMTPIPASIHVTLRGSTRAIDRLIQTGVAPVEIDLRDGQKDTVVFEPGMFTLPPDVEITIVDPPSIDLEWQDVVTRQIPVQASITGKPAEGFVVKGEPEVDPQQMTVRGPVSLVETMQFVRLAAFDVSGLTEGVYRRPIAMDAPPNRISYIGPKNATVTVTIARRVSEARFTKRPVDVVGVATAVTTPRTVDVTIIGPPEVVRALRAEQVVPRVDLTKVKGLDLEKTKHGSVTAKVTVDVAHADAEIQPPDVAIKW
ncbi:MAG: YbbR-like domain-containing protein [Myxococcales bacterium]|nr:YbbR-like domain-containing protein [Myxococcales bacterium]MCB9575655.1 YbbR-like domain-containing protein [Polyangiaceae bacterium]